MSVAPHLARLLSVAASAAREQSVGILANEVVPEVQTLLRSCGVENGTEALSLLWNRREEFGHTERDGLLLMMCSAVQQLSREDAVRLMAPYIPSVVDEIQRRYPKTRILVRICRWVAPIEFKVDPKEGWGTAVRRVLREVSVTAFNAQLTCKRYNVPPQSLEATMASAKCEVPILLAFGDSAVATRRLASFLLFPHVCPTDSASTPFTPKRTNPLAFAGEAAASEASFTVYLYSDTPHYWSMDALLALPGSPFSVLKQIVSSNHRRTTVTGVGVAHPLLRTMVLVTAPPCGPACPKTSARYTEILEILLGMSDESWCLFDDKATNVSVELHSMLCSRSTSITRGHIRLAICENGLCTQRQDIGALRAYGILLFQLARILHLPHAPYLYFLDTAHPQLGDEDGKRFLFHITEELPLEFVDSRLTKLVAVLTTSC